MNLKEDLYRKWNVYHWAMANFYEAAKDPGLTHSEKTKILYDRAYYTALKRKIEIKISTMEGERWS